MTKQKKLEFGLADIPLSCSMFLEPALKKYNNYIVPISRETGQFVHEWNRALLDVMQRPQYRAHLGEMGYKILNRTIQSEEFPAKCIEHATDVPLQSLHYALRFSESVNYLGEKIKANNNIRFVDLGCGLSPMTAAIQNEYKLAQTYCIDIPEIMDVYTSVVRLLGIAEPASIQWDECKTMAQSHQLDTIIAMGVFPYIEINEQIARLKFINTHFQNFLLEIKYNNKAQSAESNVFDIKKLQRLKMDIQNADTIETKMIQNSLRYLHRFMCAMPGKKYFLENSRSLFLGR